MNIKQTPIPDSGFTMPYYIGMSVYPRFHLSQGAIPALTQPDQPGCRQRQGLSHDTRIFSSAEQALRILSQRDKVKVRLIWVATTRHRITLLPAVWSTGGEYGPSDGWLRPAQPCWHGSVPGLWASFRRAVSVHRLKRTP
jgi:hypothetical protein